MGTLVEHQAAEAVEEIVFECEIDAENALFDLPPSRTDEGARRDVLDQVGDDGAIRRLEDFWESDEGRAVLGEFETTTRYDVADPELLRVSPEWFVERVVARRAFGHPHLAGLACLYCSREARAAFEDGDFAEARRLADAATKWAIAARAAAPFEHMAQLRDEAAEAAGLGGEIRRIDAIAAMEASPRAQARTSSATMRNIASRRRPGTNRAAIRDEFLRLSAKGVPARQIEAAIAKNLNLERYAEGTLKPREHWGPTKRVDMSAISDKMASGASVEEAALELNLCVDYVVALLKIKN